MTDGKRKELRKRMRGPQRHRLLQGYPQPPLMRVAEGETGDWLLEPENRPLLVGVLPHAACNPTVPGCGYCTFPHEDYRATEVRQTVLAVIDEIDRTYYRNSKVASLYFGGGTANLTPPDLFSQLCRKVARSFNLREAEVTLEGAPVYFSSHGGALLDTLWSELPCPHVRVSMGVQTFDPELIAQMGRQHIGGPEAVRKAVLAARRRDILTSADLMINMPGQSLDEMKSDVRRASDLGFSQLSIYHLVLFRGLGISWAREPDKLAALPDNERAFANWLEVRAFAEELGYRQTTLTNFQREGQFLYEEYGYQPQSYDLIGFGPEALSVLTSLDWNYGVKWMNVPGGAEYREVMSSSKNPIWRYFLYDPWDLRLLYLTRGFARLRLDRADYKQRYESDMLDDFGPAWEALQAERLVVVEKDSVALTERGMFFADSVVGLLASDRVAQIRGGARLEEPPVFRMG